MSELSYKHDAENSCIEIMLDGKEVVTWVCDGGDPEVEFSDFKKIYEAGKASAVMDFVNTQVGAFESGFVDDNEVSLYSMYRYAQHHVKDNYGVEVKNMAGQWGKALVIAARTATENVILDKV